MPNYQVILPLLNVPELTYSSITKRKIGELVIIPYRNTIMTGIIYKEDNDIHDFKLRNIESEELFTACISDKLIKLIEFASNYYVTKKSNIAKLVLPLDVNKSPIKIHETEINQEIKLATLSEDQQIAYQKINHDDRVCVIQGVTGSGKTELYFYSIYEKLQAGKQALVLLPEISLSTQIIERFKQRFGFEPAIWNSNITPAKKRQILRGIISGDVKVVIGARSSLFLPYLDLGIIVVDEEHDGSYKQDDGVLYNARDMAVMRGKLEKSKVLLVSATPSMETIYNINEKKYDLIQLSKRYKNAALPEIELINMKQEDLDRDKFISKSMLKEINLVLDRDEQVLLFLNRRGYAPLLICKECGFRAECSSCSSSLVVHKGDNELCCHHCGFTRPVFKKCPECKSDESIHFCGPGIERAYEEMQGYFPNKVIKSISSQQSNNAVTMQEILQDMQDSKIDILIGTQIITKGYHFPNLTLACVIDADLGFFGSDIRSSEKTYQLLQQVAGRAGRADKKGKAILQTYYPENKVINALKNGEIEEFIKEEMKLRKESDFPPYSRMAIITITGNNSIKTKDAASNFTRLAPKSKAKIFGPTEAAIHKLAGKYRYKILVISARNFNLQEYLRMWERNASLSSIFHLKMDIDPYNSI